MPLEVLPRCTVVLLTFTPRVQPAMQCRQSLGTPCPSAHNHGGSYAIMPYSRSSCTRTERELYYKHRQKAQMQADKYMSIIIDGMEQKTTWIPRFVNETKTSNSMWKLRTQAVGAIVHGRAAMIFITGEEYPKDSNQALNIIVRILHKFKDSLPNVLYIQLDNCWRENKNQFLFHLCALLVELKIFCKIKVCFLMKGHTHEDIDQMFSRYSTWLQKNTITTKDGLMKAFKKSYNKYPSSAEELNVYYNIRDWLTPFTNQMLHQSIPHKFKFVLNENGKAVMFTKEWTDSSEWVPATLASGSQIILEDLPKGAPSLVQPKYSNIDVERLQNDIQKVKALFDEEDCKWWDGILRRIREEEWDDREIPWLLDDVLQAKSHICKPKNQNISDFSDENEEILNRPVTLKRRICANRKQVQKSTKKQTTGKQVQKNNKQQIKGKQVQKSNKLENKKNSKQTSNKKQSTGKQVLKGHNKQSTGKQVLKRHNKQSKGKPTKQKDLKCTSRTRKK